MKKALTDSSLCRAFRTTGSADTNYVAQAPERGSLLYVDMLNYLQHIFPIYDWNCGNALRRVNTFVNAAQQSGWRVKAFLDDKIPSAEAQKKWTTRREKEVSS